MELGTIIRIAHPSYPADSPHIITISDVKPGEYQTSITKIDGQTAKITLTHINYIDAPYIQGSVEHYNDNIYKCTVVRNVQGDAVNIYVTFIEEE